MYNKVKDGLINGAKDHKSFKELIDDAIRFTFKKPSVILFLGLLLFTLEGMNDIFEYGINNHLSIILIVLFLVLAIILSFYESGYSYFIFEKSMEGSFIPPSIFNYKEILHHGIKDFTIFFIYMFIMILIQMFLSYLNYTPFYSSFSFLISCLSSFIGGLFILVMYISLINLAFNSGKFKSAFNFKEILKILHNIGILRFILILIILDLADFIFLHLIVVDSSLIGVIYRLIVIFIFTPAVLLFSKRLLIMSALH